MNFFAIDTETTGLNYWQHDIFGASWCEDINSPVYKTWDQVDKEALKKIFNSDRPILFHNAKFDLHMLRKHGFPIPKNLHDSMIMSYIYNENTTHSLENLSHKYLNVEKWKDDVKKLVDFDAGQTYADVPYEVMKTYAERDVKYTLQLGNFLASKLKDEPKLWELYLKEMELLKELIQIEEYGVKIDTALLADMTNHLQKEIDEHSTKVYYEAGEQFNIESPDELANILFDKLKLPVQGYTQKDHKRKIDDYCLEKLDHPIIQPLKTYRLARHMKRTYCDNIKGYLDAGDILHCNFKQNGTTTGRFSCVSPNLQNIPKIHRIRELFIPRLNCKWYLFDYKQMEMRLYAYFANDAKVKEWFKQGVDPYYEMAKIYYKKSEVTKSQRDFIKGFTLGKLYGLGISGTMNKYHKTKREAYRLHDEFNKAFPLVKRFNKKVIDRVLANGFIESPFGRRRRLNERGSYKGMNALIQGSGGDIMKEDMIKVNRLLANKKSNVIISIHDELLVEVHNDEAYLVKEIVNVMQDYPQFEDVDMLVDIKMTDTNWKEAKKNEL